MSTRQIRYEKDKFNAFLDSIEYQAKESDLTPDKRAERRRRADNDEFEFCIIYFPQIFDQPFNKMHRSIKKLNKGKHSRSGARLIGKSAYSYFAKAVRGIATGLRRMICIGLRNQEKAKERTASLARNIKKNKLLMYDYNIKIIQDRKGYYIINQTTIIAGSVEQGLRVYVDDDMKRFDLIILDDLYDRTTVSSDKDNKKVFEFIVYEAWGQLQPGTGLCLTLGNSLKEGSPMMLLRKHLEAKELEANHFSLPALVNNKTCWPESKFHSAAFWLKIKNDVPFDVWMGDYMDSPLTEGNYFRLEWLRSINLNLIKFRAVITHLDPAHGQSPSACYKAAVTIAETTHDKIVVADVYIRKDGWPETFDYLNNVRAVFSNNFKMITFENDFNQWAVAEKYYADWIKKSGNRLPLYFINAKDLATIYHGADKHGRIGHLVYPFQKNIIYFNSAIFDGAGESGVCRTDDMNLFRAMYVGYDGTDKIKIDGLDAMAGAFIVMPRFSGSGSGFSDIKFVSGDHHGENAWLNR